MTAKEKVQNILKLLFIPLSFITLFLYVYFTEGISNILNVFKTVNYRFFFYAILVNFLATPLDVISKHRLRKYYQKDVTYWDSLHTSMISLFWGKITPPFLSGAVFSDIYYMHKQGLAIADGTTLFFARSIISTISSMIMSIAMFCISFSYLKSYMTITLWIIFGVSFIIKILGMVIYLITPLFDKQIYAIGKILIHTGHKLHLIKHEDVSLDKTRKQITKLKINMQNLHFSFSDWALAIFINIIITILGFVGSWLTIKTLNVDLTYPFYLYYSTGVVADTITSVISILPSGFGISEIVNFNIASPIVGVHSINFVLLFKRLIGYYPQLLVQLICVCIPLRKKATSSNQEYLSQL